MGDSGSDSKIKYKCVEDCCETSHVFSLCKVFLKKREEAECNVSKAGDVEVLFGSDGDG